MLSTKYSLFFPAFLSPFPLLPSSSLRGRAMLSSCKWALHPLLKRKRFAVTTTQDFPFWCLMCCVIAWSQSARFARWLGEDLPKLCWKSPWSLRWIVLDVGAGSLTIGLLVGKLIRGEWPDTIGVVSLPYWYWSVSRPCSGEVGIFRGKSWYCAEERSGTTIALVVSWYLALKSTCVDLRVCVRGW